MRPGQLTVADPCRSLRSNPEVEAVVTTIHGESLAFEKDRFVALAIDAARKLIVSGRFCKCMPAETIPGSFVPPGP